MVLVVIPRTVKHPSELAALAAGGNTRHLKIIYHILSATYNIKHASSPWLPGYPSSEVTNHVRSKPKQKIPRRNQSRER